MGLANEFVGLGITYISLSTRLSVRWGRRVESKIVDDNCDLLHCPLVDLSFGVGDWIRRFGDYHISFSARLSVPRGRRVESYFKSENCELLHFLLVDLSFGVCE